MPRQLRIEFPGALYLVTNRGSRGAAVFLDDPDRDQFLRTLEEAGEKAAWAVHALCLMPDHFHVVIETPQGNLVSGMKWFLGTYTNRFNRRHRTRGHVFAGRYRGLPISPDGRFLAEVCDYVHLNPARAGLVSPDQPLETYRWSSYPAYVRGPSKRPTWLTTRRLQALIGCGDDSAGCREFARRLESRRQAPGEEAWVRIRRGWYLGDEAFRNTLMDRLTAMQAHQRPGRMRLELANRTADRIIAEELSRLGLNESQLAGRPKTAPEKIAIAERLRRETVLSIRWIAARLSAGSPNTLRNSLQALRNPAPLNPVPRAERIASAGRSAGASSRSSHGREQDSARGDAGGGIEAGTLLPGGPGETDSDRFSVAWD